jgi:hypothetical protein
MNEKGLVWFGLEDEKIKLKRCFSPFLFGNVHIYFIWQRLVSALGREALKSHLVI